MAQPHRVHPARADRRRGTAARGTVAAVACFVALIACGSRRASLPRTDEAFARHDRSSGPVVVTLVVDQFAAWVAEERLPTLPDTGGFARLRREGTWYTHVRYAHAVTDTAPGHSSLYSAAAPRESGIHANEIVDASGSRVSILRDASTRLLAPSGPTTSVGSSIARLRVATLADRLKASRGDSVVVSVSLKDRGAIFGGGRRPDAMLWFDPAIDSFVTSTAFAREFPAWATRVGGHEAVLALRATPWTLLDAAWVRAHSPTPDLQPGEGDLDGWGTTFPHDFTRARRPGGALRASPRGDQAVLHVAAESVRTARRAGRPMLLAISLSSNDYVGHVFGPDSWEAWDELRQLDHALGEFFRDLDRAVGPDRWTAILSADHGTINLPEATRSPDTRPWCRNAGPDPYERPCSAMMRLIPDVVARDLEATADRAIGEGHWVLGVADPFVYLTPASDALEAPRRRRLMAALGARLRESPALERVIEIAAAPAECPPGESLDALLCHAIPNGTGAAFYAVTRAGAFFDPGYVEGFGTSHGSPFLYDRTVPLFVRAPGRAAAGRVVHDVQSFTRFFREAATSLGLRDRPDE